MKHFLAVVFKRKTRLYLYGVSIAVTGFLGIKGILDSNEIMYLNFVFLAIFGLAAVNVPTRDSVDPPPTSPAANALADTNEGVPEAGEAPPTVVRP